MEINPIIVRDVMLGRFRDYSGNLYADPRVAIHVDDGRSFVRRSTATYDVIQASLVDTWAATAAGAYTLTENSLYTSEAFGEYLDHLTDNGVLTITRWVFDGLRLVSLAQEACAARGLDPARHLAIVRHDRVATFLLKKQPFTPEEVDAPARRTPDAMGFVVLYAPGSPTRRHDGTDPPEMIASRTSAADYARLIRAADRQRFIDAYPLDIRATTDDRPFFFHTTRLADQFDVAFGRSMLFGNGLSALLTLFGISAAPRRAVRRRAAAAWRRHAGRGLGAVARLLRRARRRVHAARGGACCSDSCCCSGHPVYSLTVTLFSLLLGTGLGSFLSRVVDDARIRRVTMSALDRDRAGRRWRRDSSFPGWWTRRSRGRSPCELPSPSRFSCRSASCSAWRCPAACDCWRTRADIVAVGLGHQWRVLGRRRHARGLHRDELGLLDHVSGRGGVMRCAACSWSFDVRSFGPFESFDRIERFA